MSKLDNKPSSITKIKMKALMTQYLNELLEEKEKEIRCPHCDNINIKKHGTTRKGVKRYYCKDCKKAFVENKNTILFKTHKDYEQWYTFLKHYLSGDTLDVCAREVGIHHNTAFRWRHKINDAFNKVLNQEILKDDIYLDEKLYPRIEIGNEELKNSKKKLNME